MALMPDRQEEQVKLLGILILAGLAALYWLYAYRPKNQELALREERVSQLQFHGRRTSIRVASLEEVRSELERYRRELDRLRPLVPTRSEIPALYDAVARTSQQTDVELVSVIPREPAPDSSAHFDVQRWSMEVEGDYHGVGRFLAEVASLDRIVRPEVTRIEPAEGSGGDTVGIRAVVELESFVLPARESSSPAGGSE